VSTRFFILPFVFFYLMNYCNNAYSDDLPRLNLYAVTGATNYVRADVLFPLFEPSFNKLFYADIDTQRSSDSSQNISLGLGTRIAINSDTLWGGYIFTDRTRSSVNDIYNYWTVINPGVEFMKNNWDSRINLYFPVGNKEIVSGTFFGDQLGISDTVRFNEHDQFDGLYNVTQKINPGADIDLGYIFKYSNNLPFRVHGGGYYFNSSMTSKIAGIEAGLEVPMNQYLTLEAADTYDNVQKYKATIGLRFTLGGRKSCTTSVIPQVEDRIFDPVYRHLGNISSSASIPVESINTFTGQYMLERNNIWFFSSSSNAVPFDNSKGTENCTFEHPCNNSSLTQTNVDFINSISSNANIYFNPGSYSVGDFSLPANDSLYGRTTDFKLPASFSSGYPVLDGKINLLGNNTLDSFALINPAGVYDTGININNADNIIINNVQIGNPNSTEGYATGLSITDANNVVVSRSTINAYTSNTDAIGINAADSQVTLFQNTINVAAIGNSNMHVFGLINTDSNTAVLNNIFNVSLNSTANLNGVDGILNVGTTAVMSAYNNTFNLLQTVSDTNSGGINTIIGIDNINGTINLINNNINLTANLADTTAFNGMTGINNTGGTINAEHNLFSLTDTLSTTASVNLLTAIDNLGGTINDSHSLYAINASSLASIVGFLNIGGTFNANKDTTNIDSSSSAIICSGGTINGANNFYGCT